MISAQDQSVAKAGTVTNAPAPLLARQPEGAAPFAATALLIAVAGGLLTGTGMVLAAAGMSEPATQELQRIAPEAIETAAQSLTVGDAAALVEGARSCKRPLGFVVVQATGRATGTIRFHSGSYNSPYLRLEARPERLALPFPAPVETGHGQIIVENRSDGADIFLLPGFRVAAGSATHVIDVHWDPKAPC